MLERNVDNLFKINYKVENDALSDILSNKCWDRGTREIFGLLCCVKTGRATFWESTISVFLYLYHFPVEQLVSDSSALCATAPAW